MAINLSGEFTTSGNPDEVFDFLSDPNKFGPLLPDFQSMSVQDPTHFTVKLRAGVGNLRGNAEIRMELAEATRPHRAQYQGQGTAVGSRITLSAGFDLSPASESTKVAWQSEANVFGKLASLAGGLLEPLGRENIQKLIDGLQKALAEQVQTVAPLDRATAATPADVASVPVEAPENGSTTAELPQGTTAPQREASDFAPARPEPEQSATLVRKQNETAEGDHGNSDARPNN